MKSKKIKMYLGIIILILAIVGIGYLVYINVNSKDNKSITQYTPPAETSDQQLRMTVVKLYFIDVNTGELVAEQRQIDSKDLVQNPYSDLVNLLIAGPTDADMAKLIPENTVLNTATLNGNTVYLDFSSDFTKDQNLGAQQEMMIINSIVNTLTELKEVGSVVFTIDGGEGLGFPDCGVMFTAPFARQE